MRKINKNQKNVPLFSGIIKSSPLGGIRGGFGIVFWLFSLIFLLSTCTTEIVDAPQKPVKGRVVAVQFKLGDLSYKNKEVVARSHNDMMSEVIEVSLENGLRMVASLEVEPAVRTRATTTTGLNPGTDLRIVAYKNGTAYEHHIDFTVDNNGTLVGDPFMIDEGYYTFVAYTFNKNSASLPAYDNTDILPNIDVNNELVWGIFPENGNPCFVDDNANDISIAMSHKFSQVMLTATTANMPDTPDIVSLENVSISGREANLNIKNGSFFKTNDNEVPHTFFGFSPLSTPTVTSISPASMMVHTGGIDSTVLKIGSLTLDANGYKTFTNLEATFDKQLKEGVSYHLRVNFRKGHPPGTILFELEGVAQNTPATVYFTNSTSRAATVNASGQIVGDKSEINLTVESLSLNGGVPVLIGRTGGETIHLKFNGAALVHRNAVNGAIPIGSYAELQLINTAAGALGYDYKQDADINLMGKVWTPIGRNATNYHFTGTYDGNRKMITGLYINNTSLDYAGLFGYIGVSGDPGEVKNLGVAGSVTGREWVGAIAGYVNPGRIENCFSTANVTGGGTTQAAGHRVGGIAGQIYTGSSIVNCYSTGNVTGIQDVGGIVGLLNSNSGTNLSIVENCYATGAVSGVYLVAGVAGQINNGGIVRNSVALNPYVHSEPSANIQHPVGRVEVRISGTNGDINKYAWDGMGTNNGEAFLLGTHATKQDVHTGYDGVSTPAATFRTAAFWTTTSSSPTTPWTAWDTSVWTITDGKLPGLFNKPVDIPIHLQ